MQVLEPDYKECIICGARLPLEYNNDCCPGCEEEKLFRQVREFIRENDCNEYILSTQMHVPLSKIRAWIRQGRIEYAETGTRIVGTKCSRCGSPINFGTLCSNCLRLLNGTNKVTIGKDGDHSGAGKMRYMDKDGMHEIS